VRVLLSDGSGLTARQCATRLAAAGHTVEVLSSDPFALCRFTRHVRPVHKVPPYGVDPFEWLDSALKVAASGKFTILFPTQEQVAILARSIPKLRAAGVSTAVPSMDALARVQDKLAARETLMELGLPQPDSTIARSHRELTACDRLPAFVKRPIGTASTGVRHVTTGTELASLAAELDAEGAFLEGGVLVQSPAVGPMVMAQAVFDHGQLVAAHTCLRIREGVGGGASQKRSVDLSQVREHLSTLGTSLAWQGALSADLILTERGPTYIDINPRLVEPGNAWRAGVDLVGALIDVATGSPPTIQGPGVPDVATHQLLLAILGAAQHRGTRRAVFDELSSALGHRGDYQASAEELTPLRHDWRAAAPVAIAAAGTLAWPPAWRWFSSGAVANYSLTPGAWRQILASTAT
jgi:biotin carboxylase